MAVHGSMTQQDFDLMCFTIEVTFAKVHQRASLHDVVKFVETLGVTPLEADNCKDCVFKIRVTF
jgi:hypothetical protein